eukprot:3293584-Prymnesium_polylepis.1
MRAWGALVRGADLREYCGHVPYPRPRTIRIFSFCLPRDGRGSRTWEGRTPPTRAFARSV